MQNLPKWNHGHPFYAKFKLDAISKDPKRTNPYPLVAVNGFRFRMRTSKPRGNAGLCVALVLDLLNRAPPANSRPVLFDGETVQITIPRQHGVHSGFVATKQAVLYLLHLCPRAFESAVVTESPPTFGVAAQPQLLALPHYNRMLLGDVMFRPKDTQSADAGVTR